ncbi:hypothetical protein SAP2_05330 [Staphylococcus arlettae]|uniref:Transposase n=1 Tax=Staphylococcus arlettae TaxID=29378 RepID=A0ABQ0XW32_9STAP|nr:hypothetical protein SAP2_05330 [Staphylococcus arlettae]GEQ00327.1 hypothetical protein SAR03_13640 [Staphylococcus arlettae]
MCYKIGINSHILTSVTKLDSNFIISKVTVLSGREDVPKKESTTLYVSES